MRADEGMLLALVLCSSAAASAQPAADAPVAARAVAPATRSARLLPEVGVAAVGGLVLPMGAYLGLTAGLQSFVGFFAGIVGATLLGAIVAPIAIIIAGHLLGAEGGTGRAVLGALAGLLVGLLIGVPLATIPGAAYVIGLGLAWVMPSVGAIIGFEWGRGAEAPSGIVVARF
jgi:hypothetical protein